MFNIKSKNINTIGAVVKKIGNLEYSIDVRGQTCPGYLLSINKEVDKLDMDSKIILLASYLPCENDIRIWCNSKKYTFIGIVPKKDYFELKMIKGGFS